MQIILLFFISNPQSFNMRRSEIQKQIPTYLKTHIHTNLNILIYDTILFELSAGIFY